MDIDATPGEDYNCDDKECYLHECVEKIVRTLPSNSASPSDQYILKFKPETTYTVYNNGNLTPKHIELGFLKTSLSATTRLDGDPHGLQYEIKIYQKIKREVLDTGASPNFVYLLDSAINCEFNHVYDILKAGRAKDKEVEILRSFVLNKAYIQLGKKNRPSLKFDGTKLIKDDFFNLVNDQYSLDSLDNVYKNFMELNPEELEILAKGGLTLLPNHENREGMINTTGVYNTTRYNFLLAEAVNDRTVTLKDFLKQHFSQNTQTGKRKLSLDDPNEILNKIVFQLMTACYCLKELKITHNDLQNSSNIWIEHLPEPVTIVYVIDGDTYELKTQYIAKIFDFDRAHCADIDEKNPNIDKSETKRNNVNNIFSPNKDALQLLRVVAMFSVPLKQYLESVDMVYKSINDRIHGIFQQIHMQPHLNGQGTRNHLYQLENNIFFIRNLEGKPENVEDLKTRPTVDVLVKHFGAKYTQEPNKDKDANVDVYYSINLKENNKRQRCQVM
jgi:hypothetical protein